MTVSSSTSGAFIHYTTDGSTPSETMGTLYTAPVTLTVTGTLQAIAYEPGYADSAIASGVYTNNTCGTPTFAPSAGTYNNTTSVTISTTTSGASIRYTTNGTTPSSTVGTVYSSPVSITTTTTTLQAIAYKSGLNNSSVASGVYTLQCAAPSFTPAAGPYGPAQSVTISTATSGATIRYTTNGTTPSSTVGTVYSSPVSITTTTTLQAIAYATNYANSSVTSGVFTINGACATPAFSPAAGTYTNSPTITISTTTNGASIRYTTNGTTPSATVGTVYGGPVLLNATGTLQAIAYASGYSNSSVASGVYTLQCAAPSFSPAAGTYTNGTIVTINTSTAGASTYYTTDGTMPSSTNGTLYSNPIGIAATCTLQAIAYEIGFTTSSVTSGVYTIQQVSASYTLDTTTSGAWWSSGGGYVYGNDGYVLCAWNEGTGNTGIDVVSLNGSSVQSVTPSGQTDYYGGPGYCPTSNPDAPINPQTGTRNYACWYSGTTETAQIALATPNDGQPHRMAVYCWDWNGGQSMYVNLLNPVSGQSELSGGEFTLANFTNGTWVVFTYQGNVELQLTNISPYFALCQVLAFDRQVAAPSFNPAPGSYTSAQSVTISTSTSGATIYYTANGTTPSSTTGRYTAAR